MTATHAYIGRKSCGCVVAAVVDMPDFKGETARSVRDFIKEGYDVQRVTLDESRQLILSRCIHEPVEPETAQRKLSL